MKYRDISREACGVAGDVDDTAWAHVGEGLEDSRRAAGARRIDDDNIGTNTLFIDARHDFRRIADDEFCVFDPVVPRIFLRVEDGGLDDFDAVDFMRFLGEEECNRPCPAVSINDGFAASEASVLQRLAVKHIRLRGVDLEKGSR